MAALGCASPTAPVPPPGGGQTLVLDAGRFEAEVWPVLRAKGCDAGGDCHGGGIRGTLELTPADAKDVAFDFEQVRHQVWADARESSPILTEPLALAAGGTPHAVKPFPSTADSGYQAIRAWVMAGEVR
jgi:hypothetical protein